MCIFNMLDLLNSMFRRNGEARLLEFFNLQKPRLLFLLEIPV
jgi:hypothetical protein